MENYDKINLTSFTINSSLGAEHLKDFILGIITISFTVIIYNGLTSLVGFNYEIFSDRFNLLLSLIDLGIWMVIFLPIYKLSKKLIVREEN